MATCESDVQQFAASSKEWNLARRNRAIAARNRFYAEHAEYLELDPTPMPFEKLEDAA